MLLAPVIVPFALFGFCEPEGRDATFCDSQVLYCDIGDRIPFRRYNLDAWMNEPISAGFSI